MSTYQRILIRATNWVGDAVMSLPAIRVISKLHSEAETVVLARPWVAGLYARESAVSRVIPYTAPSGARGLAEKWRIAGALRRERFDCAVLLQNAFEAAAVVYAAGIPVRIGYDRDARGWMLTHAVPVPKRGEIPRHERYYYLELLRRAGWTGRLQECDAIRLEGAAEAAIAGRALLDRNGLPHALIGISPGAAYGTAKRWLPERFADAALRLAADLGTAGAAVFGSESESPLAETVASLLRARGVPAENFAGRTSLTEFLEMTAACTVFLTNDSGAMHISSALGVPTVAVFGATDDVGTGPTGPLARVVRQPVDCSPCLLRECPIDHRCMTGVSASDVAAAARSLLRFPG